jgi:DNA-binding SARP family transcriptional activator
LPPGRQEVVLVRLLLDANRVVSIDQLIEAVWDDHPPATARTQVQICVSGLRSTLSGIGLDRVIVTKSFGYLLAVADDELDAKVFADQVASANALALRGEFETAAQLLREADALWRGAALSGTTSRTLQARAAHLDETRLSALESSIDLELRLGHHYRLIGEIQSLVLEHQLRERLRAQLMLALYRSGRQADALAAYRAGREILIDQLGLEPGQELRQLEHAILVGDPSLDLPPRPQPGTVGPARKAFQLPADIADFAGRSAVIGQLENFALAGHHRRAAWVAVIQGSPGIGKSAVAVHVAHRVAEGHFPDGQLYCDLGGTRPEPTTPGEVLGRFLRALGMPGPAIPDSLDERAEIYRSLLVDKRILIVLDDAAGESQLPLLLPGAGDCVVFVTSRVRLTGLPGARTFDIDVMDFDEAHQLLCNVIGRDRVSAEPAAAATLIQLVGRLPLALRILAARLSARPKWSLAWMLERLSDERRRLDELAHGDLMMRASLALTYNSLKPAGQKLLRLLGGLEFSSLPRWVAAALLNEDFDRAVDLLESLVDVHMLEIDSIDLDGSFRYRLHDMIRLFAREQLEEQEPAEERAAGLLRIADGWLSMASEAHRRVYGGDYTIVHGSTPSWQVERAYLDAVLSDPLSWFEAERRNLAAAVSLAATAGLTQHCWDLAVTLVTLYELGGDADAWEHTHRIALAQAEAAGDRRGAAVVRCSMASLQLSRNQPTTARELAEAALGVFLELGELHAQAMARRNLALADHLTGRSGSAADGYRAALVCFQAAGDIIGQAHVLAQLAQLELDTGDLAGAEEHLGEALRICRGVDNQRVDAQIRYRLARVMVAQRRYDRAERLLSVALSAVRQSHDVTGMSLILARLAEIKADLGQPEEAKELLLELLALRERTADIQGGAQVRAQLAELGA